MKKLYAFVVCLLVMGLVVGSFGCAAPKEEAIVWKALTSWPEGKYEVLGWDIWVDKMKNTVPEERLKIEWVGGPEAVHPFEQLPHVRDGLFQVLWTHSAYHTDVTLHGQVADLFLASLAERRESGLHTVLDERYQEVANVKFLGEFPAGHGYRIFLNKKIDKADLTGLKLRASPFYLHLVEGIGGAAVVLPGGEIYEAMQRGTVDGFCWPEPITPMRWHEVTKYIVEPPFGETNYQIQVNLDSWKALPKDLQDLVMKATASAQEEFRSKGMEIAKTDLEEQLKAGMEIIQLPAQDQEKILTIYFEGGWEKWVLTQPAGFISKLESAVERLKK